MKGAYEVEARLRGDSAAGRGIAQRVGCGRVRHLDASLLWLQEAVKRQEFKVSVIAGTANPSDIGTKAVPTARLRELSSVPSMRAMSPLDKLSMKKQLTRARPRRCSRVELRV